MAVAGAARLANRAARWSRLGSTCWRSRRDSPFDHSPISRRPSQISILEVLCKAPVTNRFGPNDCSKNKPVWLVHSVLMIEEGSRRAQIVRNAFEICEKGR